MDKKLANNLDCLNIDEFMEENHSLNEEMTHEIKKIPDMTKENRGNFIGISLQIYKSTK